ncbi:MAG: cyclic nucleotide-binding domain-containing protein [Pseudomonadota bacterium]
MDANLYKKLVAKIPLFESLTPEELDRIIRISKLVRIKPGIQVVKEGSQANSMYMLVEGTVRVEKSVPGARELTHLADITAPSVFGEMALIDGSPRSATVTSATDTVLLIVELASFQRLRRAYNPAAFKILRELAYMLCKRLDEKAEIINKVLENPEGTMGKLDEFFNPSDMETR